MPDAPDNFRYALQSDQNILDDMGELAARLYSPVSFDRNGRVVFLDDMSHGLTNYTVFKFYGTETAQVVNEHAWQSGFSVLLEPVNSADSLVTLGKSISLPIEDKIGLEVWLKPVSANGFTELFVNPTEQGHINAARIRLQYKDNVIQLLNSAGAYQDISVGIWPNSTVSFAFPVKLVIDRNDLKYHRLKIANLNLDISAYGMNIGALNATNLINFGVNAYRNSYGAGKVYVNNMVFTYGEL